MSKKKILIIKQSLVGNIQNCCQLDIYEEINGKITGGRISEHIIEPSQLLTKIREIAPDEVWFPPRANRMNKHKYRFHKRH